MAIQADERSAIELGVLGEHVKRPIASRDMFVRDPVIGTHRHIVAGQAVPVDLVEVYEREAKPAKRGAKPDDE
jgi:hypothetical protein